MDYEVTWPGHRLHWQVFHINLLKKWQKWEGLLIIPFSDSLELGPPLEKSDQIGGPMMGKHLSATQHHQL